MAADITWNASQTSRPVSRVLVREGPLTPACLLACCRSLCTAAACRWSDALDCFALAFVLSEPGSAEQAECEQQLLSTVQKLTRQQLADRLLEAAAAANHQNDAVSLVGPHRQQLQQQQHSATAVTGGVVVAVLQKGAATAAPAAAAGAAVAGLLAQRHPEELREGMFQLVKLAQQQQQQQGSGSAQQQGSGPKVSLHRMQALLLKWILLNSKPPNSNQNGSSDSNGCSSSRPRGAVHLHSSMLPAVLDLELQLLVAQLAVRVKSWGAAQQVATALQEQLKTLVLPDEGVLLQLLVDTHITLGEAFWADGPDNSSSTTSTSSSSSNRVSAATGVASSSAAAPAKAAGDTTRCFCQPYKAAAACLTALDLLPISKPLPQASGSSSSSSSSSGSISIGSGKASWSFLQLLLRSGGVLAGSGTATAAAADQLRRAIQGRLDAALEQLDDYQQAAVWAATAAARSNSGDVSRAAVNSSNSSGSKCADTAAAAAEQNKTSHQPGTAAAEVDAESGCVGTAAVDSGGSSTQGGSEGVLGWELACMQLGVTGAPIQLNTGKAPRQQVDTPGPSLLLEVTLAANKEHRSAYAGHSSSSSSSSSSIARGLSGPGRVALLKDLARASGVGRLAVALGHMKLAQPHAAHISAAAAATAARSGGRGGEGEGVVMQGSWHHRFQEFSFRVQFGSDVSAATAFSSLCSSLPTLLSACTELTAALVVNDSSSNVGAAVHSEDATLLQPAAPAAAAAAAAAAKEAAAADAGSPAENPMLLAATAACLQLYEVAAVSLTDVVLSGAVLTQPGDNMQQRFVTGSVEGLAGVTTVADAVENILAAVNDVAGSSEAAVDIRHVAAVDGGRQGLAAVGCSNNGLASVDTRDLAAGHTLENSLAAVNYESGSSEASVDTRDLAAVDGGRQQLAAVDSRDLAASAVIPLPYAHYSLVGEDGRPMERPDKHPFALSRVMYDARDLPTSAAEVWFEAPDGSYRWRQTASTVLLQLHALPDDISSAKQLHVTIEPYTLTVMRRPCQGFKPSKDLDLIRALEPPGALQASRSGCEGGAMLDAVGASLTDSQGELLFEAELARGIVPEDSTWVLVRPDKQRQRSVSVGGGTAAAGGLLQLAAGGAAAASRSEGSDGCYIIFELEKMNLELYERPNQHSASWWPRLFADDAADIAWDDSSKDYTDLPPAIAAAAAAEAAREEQQRRQQEERKAATAKLEALVLRHKQYRWERLRELKAAAWNAAASSSTSCSNARSSSSSIASSCSSEGTSGQ